jgi:hypothetical protein
MDADRTPNPRGSSAEPGPWRGAPHGGDGTRANRTGPTWSDDSGADRSVAGEAITGVLDPNLRADGVVGPMAVPDAAELFGELVTRRRAPIGPTPVRTARPLGRPPARARSPRRGHRRLGWTYAVVLVVLAAGVAMGVSSRAQLQRTDAGLTAMRARLHQTVGRARQAESTLAAVTAQASSAAHLLSTETAQLASVQSQLASTEANVFANGVSINDLDTCLSGVEQALNEISLNDQHDAATTLNGVAASCRAAAPSP